MNFIFFYKVSVIIEFELKQNKLLNAPGLVLPRFTDEWANGPRQLPCRFDRVKTAGVALELLAGGQSASAPALGRSPGRVTTRNRTAARWGT
jgi:hypothetical protein